ncbi:MAG: Nif3-like dinuclear metal center hexameric protein, partial [Bacteroidales bacterium]|nr:Nif3-like dinuclear metal center hexameric protein [Bacteroidales bacterium]
MKISEITRCLEEFAPLSYQENYDNSGLIIGNHNTDISKALISLDCTEEVVDEAIKTKVNLIISHHPLIFSEIKKITGKSNSERAIIKAIRNNIAVYAFHTNLDNVEKGVNYKICEKLGLKNTKILSPQNNLLRKLVTFCPSGKIENVRKAIFEAGAGVIGNYDECSYNIEGTGTFRAGEGTNPYVGKKGKRHYEKEIRIEVIYPVPGESKILNALIKSHPYEEVAYDIYPLSNELKSVGSGMLGELQVLQNETDFLKKIKSVMKCKIIKHTKLLNKKVKKVAVCGGSGSFLLNEAIRANADIFITSDFKYHQ